MAPVQPGRNYSSKIIQRSRLLCSASIKTSETHQLIESDAKTLSLLAWNYSPTRDAEIGVPEYASEALGIAEEVVELLVHSVKSLAGML